MKVLHLIPHLDQGGAEKLLVELCDHASADVTHRIVTMFEQAFFRPRSAAVDSVGAPNRLAPQHVLQAARAVRRLRAIVARERPDIVHGWLYYGNLLSAAVRGLAPRVVWSIHNTTFQFGASRSRLYLVNRVSRALSGRVPDRIVYCADAARRLHEAYGYDRDRSVTIPNGVDLARFRPDAELRRAARAQMDLPEDCLVLACFARFDPQKNLPFLFEAVAQARPRLGPMRLVLAGRGLSRDNAELTRLLDGSRLADCVVPLGPVSDMPAHMNAADIVLLASGYGEALPIALIEAAACERAIVSTDVGDVAAIGIPPDRLVPADDLAGFAEALVREGAAWRDGSSRARLAATARHARQGFSLDACVGAYEALYRELAARDRA